jgi:hypothetical protein
LTSGQQVLTSWKEIACYLGKGVRTVQRWEAELGLPVRRPRNDRHIVLAFPAELDAWARPELEQTGNLRKETISPAKRQVDELRHLTLLQAQHTRLLVEQMMETARANRARTEQLLKQCKETLNYRRRSQPGQVA